MYRPVCAPVLVFLLGLCVAPPDRPAPTPATAIWYSPHAGWGSCVGGEHRFRLTGVARKGKRARNTSRNRPCEGFHLEGIKYFLQFWEKRVKHDVWEKRKQTEEAIKGVSKLRNLTGFRFITLLRDESKVLVRCKPVVCDLTLVW